MTEPRRVRDEIERVQSELRLARAQLATPLDVDGLNREIGARLTALATECDELTVAIRGNRQLRGLVDGVEGARLWCLDEKTRRFTGDLDGAPELLGFLALTGSSIGAGVQAGGWLGRLIGTELPWTVLVTLCVLGCAVVFSEVAALVRELRGSTEPRAAPAARTANDAWIMTAALVALVVGLSASYGIGQFRVAKHKADLRAAEEAAVGQAVHAGGPRPDPAHALRTPLVWSF